MQGGKNSPWISQDAFPLWIQTALWIIRGKLFDKQMNHSELFINIQLHLSSESSVMPLQSASLFCGRRETDYVSREKNRTISWGSSEPTKTVIDQLMHKMSPTFTELLKLLWYHRRLVKSICDQFCLDLFILARGSWSPKTIKRLYCRPIVCNENKNFSTWSFLWDLIPSWINWAREMESFI